MGIARHMNCVWSDGRCTTLLHWTRAFAGAKLDVDYETLKYLLNYYTNLNEAHLYSMT